MEHSMVKITVYTVIHMEYMWECKVQCYSVIMEITLPREEFSTKY